MGGRSSFKEHPKNVASKRSRNGVAGLAACLALLACTPVGIEPAIEPEPILSEPSAELSVDEPFGGDGPRAGVVTAGDIDDGLNLAAFARHEVRAASALGLPRAPLRTPLIATFRGPDGSPAPGVNYTLRRPGEEAPFHSGVSGVDGRILVFPSVIGAGRIRTAELRAFGNGREIARHSITAGAEDTTITLTAPGVWSPEFLDLVLVIDTSGSMGDEHAWLTQEFTQVVRSARAAAPGLDIRYGLVAYRSPGDNYAVRDYGFTKDPSQIQSWLAGLDATGGAGGPEVAARALQTAADMRWRQGRGERLIFQIGDEPPARARSRAYHQAAAQAARQGVQVFGLGASGIDKDMELLMRQAALVTGGRYLFLTDDSGVGRAHAEPAIACYRVTTLKSLLDRVLRSELTGVRQEAEPGQIIRTVGTYRRGTCLQ